jgi:hypothetical protein
VNRARACEPLRVPHPISKTFRAADPASEGASQALARFTLRRTAAACMEHATLSHSWAFDQEFHPPSIGPRQGINCRRAIVLRGCLGQWLLCQFTAATSWAICTSPWRLDMESPAKKKKDAVQPPACRGPGDSTTTFTINFLPVFPLKMHLSRSPSCSAENWVSSRPNGGHISTSRRMRRLGASISTLQAQWSLSSPMQAPCRLPSAG